MVVGTDGAGPLDTGEILIWSGGATLSGTPSPIARLRHSAAVMDDNLTRATGYGILLVDVTGDGQVDVVAGGSIEDVSGVVNAGALHVWIGGPSLVGDIDPQASLTVPGALNLDKLGQTFDTQAIHAADVTGDGILDLFALAHEADALGVSNSGAAYLWVGPILESAAPDATLAVPGAQPDDRMGD